MPDFKAKIPPSPHHLKLIKSWPFLVLLALFLMAKALLAAALPQPKAAASDLTIGNILLAVNKERELRNLTTLKTDSRLSLAAQSKSDDIIARHYFSHTDPEGNYIWPKIVAAGYTPYLQLGENLAIEFYDTESLVSAWMNSPTHRANVLNDGFQDQGMGLSFGSGGEQYHSAIANTFGTLVAAKAKVAAAAAAQEPAITKAPAVKAAPSKTTPKKTDAPKNAAATEPLPAAAEKNPATSTPVQNAPLEEIKQDASVLLAHLKPRDSQPVETNAKTVARSPAYAETASNSPREVDASAAASQNGEEPSVIPPIAEEKSSASLNQKVILAFGALLLLLMIADIKIAAEQKLSFLDKKINNLAVLIISIIVIAFLYWL